MNVGRYYILDLNIYVALRLNVREFISHKLHNKHLPESLILFSSARISDNTIVKVRLKSQKGIP